MTHLRIEQNNIPETVSAAIIRKLYETALSVPEPNEGEEDSAYLSGTLQTPYAYKSHVDYLTERFSNLYINVTSDYYIEFTDPKVEQYLIAAGIGDGVGITYSDAASTDIGDALKYKTDITSFMEFKYFTYSNSHPNNQWFLDCTGLVSVELDNVTSLPGWAFDGCYSLTSVTGISYLENVGNSCFGNCPLTNVNLQDLQNIKIINNYCFYHCALSGDLYLPKLVTANGEFQFSETDITSATCLGKLSTIPRGIFSNERDPAHNGSLISVYLPYECTTIQADAFSSNNQLSTIKQYAQSVDDWVEGEVPAFKQKFTVTTIGRAAFKSCSSLTSFDFDNVQTINSAAFYGCSNLTIKLNCPNLNNLGSQSFARSGITEIENLGSITALDSYNGIGTFGGCVNLQKVQLPNTIRTLYEKSFSSCTNLTYIYGLENITRLDQCCFNEVISINNVLNFSNLTTIASWAFGDERGSTSRVRKQIYLPKLTASSNSTWYTNWYSHSGTFQNINTDLLYFRDIQAFHPYDFCYTTCTALVINNVTPPSWNNNSDRTDNEQQAQSGWQAGWREYVLEHSTITNIYVPDSAVTTYQQDSNWSTVANKILPLSQLTKVATEADLQAGQVALIEAYM